ncbi:hypothetical protein [Treponema bryantii]|uniref:hypothetical protein n=1 Tax=Treponema bryantii TaxID=163 RepID=UPI0003B74F35|nr:hypothetical protein [Treponema bryantii]
MGERLVTKISYKGQFFAASYQHWSAAAWKQLENILNELIIEHGFFENNHVRTKNEAVQILFEMLTKWNNATCSRNYKTKHGLGSADVIIYSWEKDKTISIPYHSEEQAAFNKNTSIPFSQSRTEGLITVDETIANDWESWAEVVNDFDQHVWLWKRGV